MKPIHLECAHRRCERCTCIASENGAEDLGLAYLCYVDEFPGGHPGAMAAKKFAGVEILKWNAPWDEGANRQVSPITRAFDAKNTYGRQEAIYVPGATVQMTRLGVMSKSWAATAALLRLGRKAEDLATVMEVSGRLAGPDAVKSMLMGAVDAVEATDRLTGKMLATTSTRDQQYDAQRVYTYLCEMLDVTP